MFGLSKLAIYLIIALFSVGAITTTYYVWKRNIQHAELMEFNRQQMEKIQKDQTEFMQRQREIADQQSAAARELAERNEELSRRMGDVDRYLSSSQAQDRPASDVLKQTIERLRSGASR